MGILKKARDTRASMRAMRGMVAAGIDVISPTKRLLEELDAELEVVSSGIAETRAAIRRLVTSEEVGVFMDRLGDFLEEIAEEEDD